MSSRDSAPHLKLTIPAEGRAPPSPVDSPPDETPDPALELCLDNALTVVERIWLFAQSNNQFHKLYVGQAMPQLLDELLLEASVHEAVTYILPLLFTLTQDSEPVREAFVPAVADVIWWFFARCNVLDDEVVPEDDFDPPVISVATFTATLGQLLLNPHTTVGQQARLQVVTLLDRVRDPEGWPAADPRCLTQGERACIEGELIYNVIIAIGQLDTLTPGMLGTEMAAEDQYDVESPQTMQTDAPSQEATSSGAADIQTPAAAGMNISHHDGPSPSRPISAGQSVAPSLAEAPSTSAQSRADERSEDSRGQRMDTQAKQAPPPTAPPHEQALGRDGATLIAASPSGPASGSGSGEDKWMVGAGSARDATAAGAALQPSQHATAVKSSTPTSTASASSPLSNHVSESPRISSDASTPRRSDDTPPDPQLKRPIEPVRPVVVIPQSSPANAVVPAQPEQPRSLPIAAPPPASSAATSSRSSPTPVRERPPHMDMQGLNPFNATTKGDETPPPPPASAAVVDQMTVTDAQASSRFAPPGNISLPPANAFQHSAAAEGETSRPPSPAGAANAKALQTALGPGTPFPTGDESNDPMALYGALPNDESQDIRSRQEVANTNDELAFGRMASMALIATVTSKCQKPFSDVVLQAFVQQVECLQDDSEHWVRREASLALGALAKVVSVEILVNTLLPLFEHWMQDQAHQVRQTAVFALPNIIERLSLAQRADLTVRMLRLHGKDEHQAVRSSMMEIMGEIIVKFKDDAPGPPKEALELFFGDASLYEKQPELPPLLDENAYWMPRQRPVQSRDPSRELTLAFNFPAVVLTLGPARWPELRGYFDYLVQCDAIFKVRRTVAASIGEIAKIIGEVHTRADLLDVFKAFLRDEADDIRLKAVTALPAFMTGLAVEDREDMAGLLDDIWVDRLKGWREREQLAGELQELVPLVGQRREVLNVLIVRALRDPVCAVRDAAITAVPHCYANWREGQPALRRSLLELAQSGSYRDRHTFALCYRSVAMHPACSDVVADLEWWNACARLANDPILDVRIGVSRTVGTLCENYFADADRRPPYVTALLQHIVGDNNAVVQSFVRALVKVGSVARRGPRRTPSLFSHFHDPHQSSRPQIHPK
ncbi:ARM repeat-containing protein [Auriculariales sp. MPI-PUGE-AT-0066]|nr:ARM repeat-containing protein [Auriculariales sp. MPI-PUGE-AT-0066]